MRRGRRLCRPWWWGPDREWQPGAVIPDGSYDVFVVDVAPLEGDAPGWQLELTILAGDHKGEVVTVNAAGMSGDELDLIGMPGTLTVTEGAPTFRVD